MSADIERLYREGGHVVVRRARRMLGSESEARDVLHEIFVELLARPALLDGVERRTAWLYQVTTRACLNRIRNHQGRTRILRGLTRADRIGPRGELLATVRQLLERLPSPLAEVAIYTYVDEMTHEEVAHMLGCSRRHVGDLLVRLERLVGRKDDADSHAG
jgi:RNA polymerase sigma-70 factor (ECF subfamily)